MYIVEKEWLVDLILSQWLPMRVGERKTSLELHFELIFRYYGVMLHVTVF